MLPQIIILTTIFLPHALVIMLCLNHFYTIPPTLPVQQFNHPMDNNITTIHIAHIQTIMQSNELNPSTPIPDMFGGRIPQSSHGQQYHYYPHSTHPNYYAIK
jgi:hypothetical protein